MKCSVLSVFTIYKYSVLIMSFSLMFYYENFQIPAKYKEFYKEYIT